MERHPSEEPMLVECEVTGEVIPEDESVVIQGKRVSARGKQILLEQLKTGHAVGGELEAPGALKRFGCLFLDGLIIGLPITIVGAILIGGTAVATGGTGELARAQGLIQFVMIAAFVAYYTLMHGSRGQTIGKIAGKIKVVNLDGSDITYGTAFIRSMIKVGIQVISALLLLLAGEAVLGISTGLDLLFNLYFFINCITVLAAQDKRGIHDFVAKTRVIELDG